MKDVEVRIVTSAVILIVSFIAVSGCFITNCPPGGKRSGEHAKPRQCESCGPLGMNGRCYGPRVCCSPHFGCLMGTVETLPCLQENQHTTLCQNPGESCSGNDESISFNGQCGANGLCCSTEICTFDDNCRHTRHQDSPKPQLSKPPNHMIETAEYHNINPHHHFNGAQESINNLIPQLLFPDPILEHFIPRKDRGPFPFRHREMFENKMFPVKTNQQQETIVFTDKGSSEPGGEYPERQEDF